MVARKLGAMRHVLCAAPFNFEAHGTPQTLKDLKVHNCVRFNLSGHADLREFSRDGRTERIAIGGRYAVTSSLAVRVCFTRRLWAESDAYPYVDDDLREGRLVAALDDRAAVETTLYAVYPSRHHLAPKIRAFLDFLVKAFTSTG
jgi:DNA-binding transcriptional LysR family regulator